MSFCKEEGKDKIIFVTEEDHSTPSTVKLADDEEPVSGLVKEDGSLNWSCPCLGGMATGPCGVEFREAFQCFHYSEADPKGSDCLEPFREMSKCMSEFPGVYGNKEDNVMNVNDDDDNEDSKEAPPSSSSDSTVGKVESSSSESDDASSSKSDNSSNDKSSSKS